jgi:hypothetical protein
MSRTSSTRPGEAELDLLAQLIGDLLEVLLVELGAMIVRIPRRWAASAFSFRPPIGRTSPWSVTSPVMATSSRTGRPVSIETRRGDHRDAGARAVLGDRARRTWMCRSLRANQSSGRLPSAWPRTHDSAAWADSRMTSPSWPVIVSLPVPGIAPTSMKSTSPPTGVHARPVATPGAWCGAWPR